jgi:hypothetical protein
MGPRLLMQIIDIAIIAATPIRHAVRPDFNPIAQSSRFISIFQVGFL